MFDDVFFPHLPSANFLQRETVTSRVVVFWLATECEQVFKPSHDEAGARETYLKYHQISPEMCCNKSLKWFRSFRKHRQPRLDATVPNTHVSLGATRSGPGLMHTTHTHAQGVAGPLLQALQVRSTPVFFCFATISVYAPCAACGEVLDFGRSVSASVHKKAHTAANTRAWQQTPGPARGARQAAAAEPVTQLRARTRVAPSCIIKAIIRRSSRRWKSE